ncbi:MAG: FAD binding domain-containing protein, partial [Deltaproteobacteria bacterium]|nr:FAD binding domain-containing protein [Deltaproteobacteria bacterium]
MAALEQQSRKRAEDLLIMIPASFEYYAPRSLGDAVSYLAKHRDDVKILSGGQRLMPLLKMRLSKPAFIVDIGKIPGLNMIAEEGSHIVLGGLVTHTQIEESGLLKQKCPLLPQTATTIADVQIRNRGTLGGSVAHADPAGDWPATIMALDAEIKVFGPNGERWVKADEFFLGLLMSVLEPDEIVTAIRVAATGNDKTAYLKAAPRSSGFAVVGVAVRMAVNAAGACERIAVGITGVTDKAY